MARQEIDLTTPQPGGNLGEPTRSAWEKVNDMTLELYANYGIPVAESLTGKKLAIIAGTLRQSSANQAQWSWISDNAHVPVGVGSIVASGDTLYISFDKTYGRVISLIAGPDETLGQMGVCVGASVNLDAFALRMCASKSIAGHVRYLGGGSWEHKVSTANSTVDGPAPSFVGTNLTVPHDFVPGGVYNHPSISIYSNNADFIPRVPSLRASGPDYFTIQWLNQTLDSFIAAADLTNRASVSYRKSYSGPISVDGTNGFAGLNLYNGNIWVLGLMELA